MVGYTLLQFRTFVQVIVLILKVPLDGNLMVWYNSLRDAYIYGRGGNSSVDAINASAASLSGTRCPSIPNSVSKTKFPIRKYLKTAIQSNVFLLLQNKLRSICWFLHSWFRFQNFSLDGMASGIQINDSREYKRDHQVEFEQCSHFYKEKSEKGYYTCQMCNTRMMWQGLPAIENIRRSWSSN